MVTPPSPAKLARSDGPFSSPNLLLRASPFIGAAVLTMALRSETELTNPPLTHVAAWILSVFLIVSPVWRRQLERLPALARPLPAAVALALSGLPILGSPITNTTAYLTLAIGIAVPFVLDAVPWGRLPRWGESLALLGSVSPMLLSRPDTHAAEMLAFPMVNIVVLFIALYGSRLELLASFGVIAAQFGLPQAGETFDPIELVRDGILTTLTAVVAVCVFQVVTIMRRQRVVILENERQANLREAWIHSVLENTADALVTIDLDGTIRDVNRAARVMFAYADGELTGRPISVFIASEGQADFGSYLGARMRHGDDGLGSGSRETTGIRSDDGTFPVEYSAGETEHNGKRVFIVSLRDITERKAKHAVLEHQALHDALTGLPNRVLLEDRLEQALAQARRRRRGTAVLMLDFNHFKQVNDRLGHEIGDRLLCEVSARITNALRAGDTLARLGGDEFVVLPAGVETADEAAQVARKILDASSQPLTIDGHEITAGVSIGVALHPEHGDDPSSLLRRADQAMYMAKRAGTGYKLAGRPLKTQTLERASLTQVCNVRAAG
jgi:diguanylate cyclase (GGDEF)-like protein/PAS domain S-box-containing protein